MVKLRLTAFLRLTIILALFGCVTSTLEELQELMEKQEHDVLKFAKEIEA